MCCGKTAVSAADQLRCLRTNNHSPLTTYHVPLTYITYSLLTAGGPFTPHHLPFGAFLQEVLGDSELAIDLFVASHPHHFQAYQTIAGKPVVNSPGQFLDDFQDLARGGGAQICPLTSRVGLRYELRFDCGSRCSLRAVEMRPVFIDNYTVNFAPPGIATRAVSRQMRTSESLGGAVLERRQDRIVVRTPHASPLRIMPMGDSITSSCCCVAGSNRCCGDANGNESTLCCRQGYRRQLHHLLEARLGVDAFTFVGSQERGYACERDTTPNGYEDVSAAPADFAVAHQGHWGWTTSQLADWASAFVRHSQPDWVLLMIGLNDFLWGKGSQVQLQSQALQNIKTIISLALVAQPGVRVLVATLPICHSRPYQPAGSRTPTTFCGHGAAAGISGFNARLTEQVVGPFRSAYGSAVSLCNVSDGFDSASMTFDGVHPNAVGERLLARRWAECLGKPDLSKVLAGDQAVPAYNFEQASLCATGYSRGRWAPVERQRFEPGSLDFYSSCFAAYGTPSCSDWAWLPDPPKDSTATSCKLPYARFDASGIRHLLRGKWLAFLGDSTTRLVFSSLVHALSNGTALPPSYPTHDFDFFAHTYSTDHCKSGNCFRDFVLGAGNDQIRMSFDMWTTLDEYPERASTFFASRYKRMRAVPDMVVLNSGPWDFQASQPYDSKTYRANLWGFLARFVELYSGPTFWLSNTAVQRPAATYTRTLRPVTDADVRQCAQLHDLQTPIIEHFRHVMINRSPLFTPLPNFYNSSAGMHNPYHLPGVMTDESLQILLNTIKASMPTAEFPVRAQQPAHTDLNAATTAATTTTAQPAAVEPSSALTATNIALAATALSKPAAAESSTSLYPVARSGCQARCREPSSLPHDTRTCSSARCSGRAHGCSLAAVKHALPPVNTSCRLLEVARRRDWGFTEYGQARTSIAVDAFIADPPAHARHGDVVLLHILVGEGVSRSKWRLAAEGAMRAGAREVWAMEHSREAISFASRSSWPVGHPANPPREADSDMFTLQELQQELANLAALHCPGPADILASCAISTSSDPRGRNLLLGVQCGCRASTTATDTAVPVRQARRLGESSGSSLTNAGCGDGDSAGLFCCHNSGAEGNQTSLYQGPRFVYTFHADAIAPLLVLGQRLVQLLKPAPLAGPAHSSTSGLKTFASVAGSMSSLNVLLELPPMDIGTFWLSTHPAQMQTHSPTAPLTLTQLSSSTSILGCLSTPRCSSPSSAPRDPEPIS